ncbi:hypothetical protein IT570_06325 [Candidatus Sumerlaeota bacterium]|nr:hypothetical protein [Candidatus Sumerlaeota bacterium]
MRHRKSGYLVALLVASSPGILFAQLGITAPPEAMDTLSGSSTGVGGLGIDRARQVAGDANAASASPFGEMQAVDGGSPFGAPPAAGDGGNPFGAPGGTNAFGEPTGGGNPFGDPYAGLAPAAAYAAPATLSAWGGERIVAHGTGQVLQDARVISILATAQGNYFDDGKNGNDATAGDNIYTNITINDDYISPEAQLVKTKIIQTLAYTSDQKAQTFFQVPVTSTEPTSPLPKVSELEERRDVKLTQWMTSPLAQFRVNPDDKESEFYPTYLPPPPRAPNIPLPVSFTPKKIESGNVGPDGRPLPAGAAGSEASAFGGDVTGEPVGNASSRYF